jgi:TonB-dependent receptor
MSKKSESISRLHSLKALLLGGVVLPLATVAHVNAQEVTDEIVVTGIQQSLKAAADVKRNSAQIVDAVVAEDIGKLPDNNIAEALQRITGVSIATDFGVGDSVSIRGLSQNRVELNGRTTTGDGRDGISLQDFPSSFLRSVEVVKSPTADMVEGALGGTVRMKTVRPLELTGPSIAGSFDYEYADKTEEWAPIANISGGNIYDLADGGRLGFVAMYSFQDREIRQDAFFNRFELRAADDSHDLDHLTSNAPEGNFIVRDQNTVEQYLEQRERTAMNLSLQYEPASQQGNFYLDYTLTDRTGSQQGASVLDVGSDIITDSGDATQDGNGQVNNYTLGSQFVIPKAWSDFRETESTSIAVGGEWNVDSNLTLSGEYSMVTSESYRPDSEFNLRPQDKALYTAWLEGDYVDGTGFGDGSNYDEGGQRNAISIDFNQSGSNIPSLTFSDPDALTDDSVLALRQIKIEEYYTNNDEDSYRLDADFADGLGLSNVDAIQFGIRGTTAEYTLDRYKWDTGSKLYKEMVDADGNPAALWLDDLERLVPGSVTTVNHPNSFDQHGLSGDLPHLEAKLFNQAILSNPSATFDAAKVFLDGTNKAVTGSLADARSQQQSSYRDISEDTMAVYATADMAFGDSISAVVGARFVQTEIESSSWNDHDGDENTDDILTTKTHDYDDFLPSLNVSYDMAEDTKLRFAAAKVMRRANYENLSAASIINGNYAVGSRGAHDLDPYRATQFDVSYEKYMGDEGMFSFAVFYKDVESFLRDTTYCEADPLTRTVQNVQAGVELNSICLLENAGQDRSQLVFQTTQTDDEIVNLRNNGLTGVTMTVKDNGENGTVQGFEVGVQMPLDNVYRGLGIAANYTYNDSEQPNGNPLLDLSENTYNIQGYYEQNGVQVRLAYNYRDEYLDTENEKRIVSIGSQGLGTLGATSEDDASQGNNWKKARGQMDLSGSYEVQDNMTLVGSITNLLGEPSTWRHELGSNWKYTEADRRISFGVRYKY